MDDLKVLTTVVQGGSFALLAFLLYWLTRWVPKRIERADLVREAEARSREALAAAHTEAVRAVAEVGRAAQHELMEAFAAEQQKERDACERRYSDLTSRIDRVHADVREAKHTVANMAQVQANLRAAEELRRRPRRAEEGAG